MTMVQQHMSGSVSAARAPQASEGRFALPLVLYIAAVLIPLEFNAGSLSMSLLRVLLLVMFFPLAFRLLSGKYGKIIITDILFFIHILWMAVTLYFNNPSMVIENTGSAGLEFMGGYMMGRIYIRTREDFIKLCKFLSFSILCLFPLAVYEAMTGTALVLRFLESLPGFSTMSQVAAEKRLGLERVQTVFDSPIHHGLYTSSAFALCFIGLRDKYGHARRWMTSGIIAVCVFLGLSSGAFLALVLQLGLIAWAVMFAKVQKRWAILIGLSAAFYVIIDLLSNRTPFDVFFTYATFSPHTAYWRALIFEWGMKNVWDNPIVGIGFNEWERPFFMYSGSMDNFWLVIGVRYGIPGFLLLMIGYLHPIFKIARRKFAGDPELMQIRLAWMIVFSGLTFTLSTVHIWTTIYSFVFFLFASGLWMLDEQPKGQDETPEEGPDSNDPRAARRNTRSPVTRATPTEPTAPSHKRGPVYSRFDPRD